MFVCIICELYLKLGNVLATLEKILVVITAFRQSADTTRIVLTNKGLICAKRKLFKSVDKVIVKGSWETDSLEIEGQISRISTVGI